MSRKLIYYFSMLFGFLGSGFVSIIAIVNLVQLNRKEYFAQLEQNGFYKEDIYILNQYDEKWFWGIVCFVGMLLCLFCFFDMFFTFIRSKSSHE